MTMNEHPIVGDIVLVRFKATTLSKNLTEAKEKMDYKNLFLSDELMKVELPPWKIKIHFSLW